jgi:proteasome alpha subunit
VFTPYDWQEGIGNRAQYIEGRLAQGAAVLAVSLDAGILVFTYRRQARKIYELYDRLLYAGLGQQSDIDAMRLAALEFATKEGFNRSDRDVTVQRVANAMSGACKRAFNDFTSAPLIAKSLFAEVNATAADDLYYALDFDGEYTLARRCCVLAGNDETGEKLAALIAEIPTSTSVDDAVERLREIWSQSMEEGQEMPKDVFPEAMLLERGGERENRFRDLFPEKF